MEDFVKKIVVFSQRVEVIESYNERRDCIDQRVSIFLSECGYLPIALPNNIELVDAIISTLNPVGIVLTGGNSLTKYGGDAPERDATDKRLIDIAIAQGIPLYGLCRGMQSILDYFGETLINVDGHVAKRHKISGDIIGDVNSYHNQACIMLQKESVFRISAKSKDEVIEAIYHKNLPIVANMWHPEREINLKKTDIERVKKLFG